MEGYSFSKLDDIGMVQNTRLVRVNRSPFRDERGMPARESRPALFTLRMMSL